MKKIILLAGLVAGGVALSVTAYANNWLLYLPAILAGSGGGTEPPPEPANNWLLYLPAILAGSQGGGTAQPSDPTGVLNDTGIVLSSAGGTCDSTGEEDCRYGRDATVSEPDPPDGHAGFSFEVINSTCVLDKVTGLAWEVKTTANKDDNNYNLAGATTYAADFGTAKGCGDSYTSCRLPTVKELLGIVSLGSAGNIDKDYFPNTAAATYLSRTKLANDTGSESTKVWGVDFTYGWTSSLLGINDSSYRVRAVCTAGGV